MRSAVLRGCEHTAISEIATIAEGPAALALSLGGAPKVYRHTEPNEDACGFALGAAGCLVVVADGHAGTDASHFAVERLLERFAPEWTDGLAPTSADAWRATATRAFAELNAAILERASERGGEPARTTLVAALVRPDDDLLAFASMGDSHLFRIGDRGAEDLAERPGQRPAFFGFDGETPEQLAEKCAIGWLPLHAARALALVSDGLSERGIGVADPARAVVDAHHEALALDAPLRPAALARGIAERALAAQRRQRSGDNLASAVLLLG